MCASYNVANSLNQILVLWLVVAGTNERHLALCGGESQETDETILIRSYNTIQRKLSITIHQVIMKELTRISSRLSVLAQTEYLSVRLNKFYSLQLADYKPQTNLSNHIRPAQVDFLIPL